MLAKLASLALKEYDIALENWFQKLGTRKRSFGINGMPLADMCHFDVLVRDQSLKHYD